MHSPCILRFGIAFLAFPLMGSSCETLESSNYAPASNTPQRRAAANNALARHYVNDLNSSMQTHGIDVNQMAYQSSYQSARERGMTPYEADAEARQFQQMWQMMSR